MGEVDGDKVVHLSAGFTVQANTQIISSLCPGLVVCMQKVGGSPK